MKPTPPTLRKLALLMSAAGLGGLHAEAAIATMVPADSGRAMLAAAADMKAPSARRPHPGEHVLSAQDRAPSSLMPSPGAELRAADPAVLAAVGRAFGLEGVADAALEDAVATALGLGSEAPATSATMPGVTPQPLPGAAVLQEHAAAAAPAATTDAAAEPGSSMVVPAVAAPQSEGIAAEGGAATLSTSRQPAARHASEGAPAPASADDGPALALARVLMADIEPLLGRHAPPPGLPDAPPRAEIAALPLRRQEMPSRPEQTTEATLTSGPAGVGNDDVLNAAPRPAPALSSLGTESSAAVFEDTTTLSAAGGLAEEATTPRVTAVEDMPSLSTAIAVEDGPLVSAAASVSSAAAVEAIASVPSAAAAEHKGSTSAVVATNDPRPVVSAAAVEQDTPLISAAAAVEPKRVVSAAPSVASPARGVEPSTDEVTSPDRPAGLFGAALAAARDVGKRAFFAAANALAPEGPSLLPAFNVAACQEGDEKLARAIWAELGSGGAAPPSHELVAARTSHADLVLDTLGKTLSARDASDRPGSLPAASTVARTGHESPPAQTANIAPEASPSVPVAEAAASQAAQASTAQPGAEAKPVLAVAAGAASAEGALAVAAEPVSEPLVSASDAALPFGPTTVAVAPERLDRLRGGFVAANGMQISFGIERAVYVNGALVTTTQMQLSNVGAGGAAQTSADAAASAGNLALIQNGAGNAFTASTAGLSSAVGTVVQNTLNDQKIQSVTLINATVNSLQMLKASNIQSSLRSAVIDSLRR